LFSGLHPIVYPYDNGYMSSIEYFISLFI